MTFLHDSPRSEPLSASWPPPRIDEMDDAPVSIVGCNGHVVAFGGGSVEIWVDSDTMRYPAVGTRVEVRVIPERPTQRTQRRDRPSWHPDDCNLACCWTVAP